MFEVRYRQNLNQNQARYILTTLRKWNKPIEEAVFIVNVPEDFKDIQLSYPADSVCEVETRRNYFITKRNFGGEKDLIISWEEIGTLH